MGKPLSEVKLKPNFGYIQDIYLTFLDVQKKNLLENEAKILKEMIPEPMNTMLTKQPKDEAIKKRKKRKLMVVEEVPPTTPISQVQDNDIPQGTKAKPHCTVFHNPMKGHNYALNCPRNNKNN